jgi:hypothetical protein
MIEATLDMDTESTYTHKKWQRANHFVWRSALPIQQQFNEPDYMLVQYRVQLQYVVQPSNNLCCPSPLPLQPVDCNRVYFPLSPD